MNFKEVFIKYKNGTASPEEMKFIEEELEKNELINDYLAEKIDLEINASYDDEPKEQVSKEIKKIKKSVNRKIVKIISFTISIMIALILLFQFGIAPAINSYFYNPNKGYVDKYSGNGQFFVDMATLTDLHFPGFNTSQAMAEPLGYGKYNLEIYQWDSFRNETTVNRGKLIRNETELPFEFYKGAHGNAFGDASNVNYKQEPEQFQEYIAELEKLPETAFVKAYVSYKNDLNMKQFVDLMERMSPIYFSWIAIRYDYINTHIGFDPTGTGVIIEKDAVDEKKYPYFELAHVGVNKTEITPKILEVHFISQVKYMHNAKSFLDSLFSGNFSPELYEEVLSYVEKNGVNTYGAVVHGNVKDILKLARQDMINSLMIDDVKISAYEK